MKNIKSFIFGAIIILSLSFGAFAQTTGSLRGQVVDDLGQVVVGATVIAVDSAGKEKTATTNGSGDFTISGLAPGKYIVRVRRRIFRCMKIRKSKLPPDKPKN